MRAIEKNKNFLEFHMDKSAPYKFDVNTGVWYGLKGKPIDNAPSGARAMIIEAVRNNTTNNVLIFMDYRNNRNESITTISKEYRRYFPILDKMTSLGYVVDTRDLYDLSNLVFVEKHIKEFAEYLKNDEIERKNLTNFIREGSKMLWLKENNIVIKNNPQITEEMIDFVYDRWKGRNSEFSSTIFYYLTHNGLWNFFNMAGNLYTLNRYFDDFFTMLNYLGEAPRKENFFQEYIKVKREYDALKNKKDNEIFIKNLMKQEKAFTFEYGEYQVVIPQTKEEIVAEAKAQLNCVAGYVSMIIDNRTYVVFVRNKNDLSKSLVTAEVSTNGRVVQFLLKQNRHIEGNADLVEFLENWRVHLQDNWNRE